MIYLFCFCIDEKSQVKAEEDLYLTGAENTIRRVTAETNYSQVPTTLLLVLFAEELPKDVKLTFFLLYPIFL
jgi:hypothetical protein